MATTKPTLTAAQTNILKHVRAYASDRRGAHVRGDDLATAKELEAAGLVVLKIQVDGAAGHAKLTRAGRVACETEPAA